MLVDASDSASKAREPSERGPGHLVPPWPGADEPRTRIDFRQYQSPIAITAYRGKLLKARQESSD